MIKYMDWTDLNHDLLRLIAKKVTNISDFIRLRVVCQKWRSVVHLSDMAPQFPYSINYKRNCNTSFDIQFYQNFTQRRIHTVPIKNIPVGGEIKFMCTSLSEFLLFRVDKTPILWLLVNPVTGFHSLIPFEINVSFAYPIYFGHSCLQKTNPIKDDIDVVFIFRENRRSPLLEYDEIGLWRYNDMEWTMIAKVPFSFGDENVTYCNNGTLCVVSKETGHTRVIDIITGDIMVIHDHGPFRGLMYLVEAGDDMLCVFQYYVNKNFEFEVYLLEDFGTNPSLRKVKSIGNWVIFIDNGYNALCLKATDSEGYQRNCIYFNSYGRHDIEKNTTEVILSTDQPVRYRDRWFIPSLF